MKQYEIINEYGYEKDYSYLNFVVENAIKKLGFCGTFSCTFIDDDKMHELNKTYRNIDKTTDVLSFAINDGETKKERLPLKGQPPDISHILIFRIVRPNNPRQSSCISLRLPEAPSH